MSYRDLKEQEKSTPEPVLMHDDSGMTILQEDPTRIVKEQAEAKVASFKQRLADIRKQLMAKPSGDSYELPLPAEEGLTKEESDKPFHGYNKEKHSKEGGLNDKYREKYNRENGSNLKRPVTGKVKPGSKAAKRRKSFCARMSGVKGPTSKDGKLTPKGAALKRWKC